MLRSLVGSEMCIRDSYLLKFLFTDYTANKYLNPRQVVIPYPFINLSGIFLPLKEYKIMNTDMYILNSMKSLMSYFTEVIIETIIVTKPSQI